MTITIENALKTPQRYPEQNTVFLQPGFRSALAREYRLQAVDVKLTDHKNPLWLPAYVRKTLAGRHLIIGAGFEQSSEVTGLEAENFTQHIATLNQQLPTHNISRLEIRSKYPIPCQPNRADKVEMVAHLESSYAERLQQASKSTRRNLNLPFKHGFHYVIDKQQQQLDDFYQLYQISMHALGTLPHSRRFFTELWQNCRDRIVIFVGYMDQQPVAASFNFLQSDELYGAWGCAHPDYKKYCVFLTMLWRTLEYCEQAGLKTFNLGRVSAGTNTHQFKQRLANRQNPIYHYRLNAYPTAGKRSPVYDTASWVIRHSPPVVMHTLARTLLHRFY